MRCHSVACGIANQTRPENAIGYVKLNSRSHDAVIRVYDAAGNVIESHEHAGDFNPQAQTRHHSLPTWASCRCSSAPPWE